MVSFYRIDNHILENVFNYKGVGVVLDSKLKFDSHKEVPVNKARSLLMFIKKWSKEFKVPYVTNCLCTSIVRATL